MLHIGIVGCGAIGSSLARIIKNKFKDSCKITALYDIDVLRAFALSKKISPRHNLAVKGLSALISRCDFVIEAASASVSFMVARQSLNKGRSVMIMSVGGLMQGLNKLSVLALRKKAKIYIPSGAISGVDALKASKIGKIKSVTLITRKSPKSFSNVEYVSKKGFKLSALKEDKVLFFGSALEAIKYFPQNINVAAVLSIAGIGAENTKVKIIASPEVKNNVHEVLIESEAGNIFARTQNVLHPDNPKTSFLAVLAAAATLKQVSDPVRVGT